MRLRTLLLALAAGIATTLLVGAAVTEVFLPAIEFSAIVGMPVGIASGLFVGALVLVVLADRSTPADRRHAATAVGAFGAATLAAFAVAVFGAGVGAAVALVAGAVVGFVAGVGTFAWLERSGSRTVHAVTSR